MEDATKAIAGAEGEVGPISNRLVRPGADNMEPRGTTMKGLFPLVAVLLLNMAAAVQGQVSSPAKPADDLAERFASPPPSARPWVYWFWINGNISKEGITADLESLQRAGVGGVLWMEVSGPWWAPEGPVPALSERWHEAFQWAIRECDRLGLEFDVSVDFGYGSGGPHITPELSMQKFYWSETEVEGGPNVVVALPAPKVDRTISAWLRPGEDVPAKVREQIETLDSYRDVAVVAIPSPAAPKARAYRIPEPPAEGRHESKAFGGVRFCTARCRCPGGSGR